MGHKGSMEAKYTTNKGILPEALISEMRDAFSRSEEFLDLDDTKKDALLEQKEDMQNTIQDTIQKATPEQLGLMLEMFQKLGIGKTDQVS